MSAKFKILETEVKTQMLKKLSTVEALIPNIGIPNILKFRLPVVQFSNGTVIAKAIVPTIPKPNYLLYDAKQVQLNRIFN